MPPKGIMDDILKRSRRRSKEILPCLLDAESFFYGSAALWRPIGAYRNASDTTHQVVQVDPRFQGCSLSRETQTTMLVGPLQTNWGKAVVEAFMAKVRVGKR